MAIIPAVIISALITAMNIQEASFTVIKPLSLSGLILMTAVMNLKKKRLGLSAIDMGIVIYTALITGIFWLSPAFLVNAVSAYPAGMLFVCLFCVTALPALFRKRYFTGYFAEKTTPEAVRNTDIYKNINRNMSWAWSALFAVSALLNTVPLIASVPSGLFTRLFFQILLPLTFMLGLGLPLNRRYPAYYQRKMGIVPVVTKEKQRPIKPETNEIQAAYKAKAGNMDAKYKVVAINGSPHRAVGNTSIMIRMLSEGLSREGIEVEEIFIADKKIDYCMGCGVCLEKKKCWRQDEHEEITDKLLAADGSILGSPVYFMHITAQMKTFIDRSLSFGHKPRSTWKPGIAVCVSAGLADSETARYLEGILRPFGAFSVGSLTAIATSPGAFLGKDLLETRAADLVGIFAKAIKEKRRYPATGDDLRFYLFMKDLVTREKDFMVGDYKHWQESGIMEGFEAYMKQYFEKPYYDPEVRKTWISNLIREERGKGDKALQHDMAAVQAGPKAAKTCLELIRMMPLGFHPEAAGDLNAVIQFELTGSEEFTAHLSIRNGKCSFHEGHAQKPDVIVKSPADVWLSISKGDLDGQTAFLSGQYMVEGNISLIMKLGDMFG
jgi:putative sterol carrier protein/NAD(P)H-dependent FMN reductase